MHVLPELIIITIGTILVVILFLTALSLGLRRRNHE